MSTMASGIAGMERCVQIFCSTLAKNQLQQDIQQNVFSGWDINMVESLSNYFKIETRCQKQVDQGKLA